jgi:outer membrane protein assembly factor BamC
VRNIPLIGLVLLTSLLAACAGQDKRYLNTGLGDDLELPPDLSAYEVKSKFELPTAFSGDDETVRDRIPVLARVESLRLRGSGNFYWLDVQEPVDNLYQLVKNFWASEGRSLVIDEAVIGVMQTEWIYTEQGGGTAQQQGWLQSLFSGNNLSATQDQFRTRIERDETSGISRIYIVHRGTEYSHTFEKGKERVVAGADDDDGDNDWRFRQPEPELEVEMLSRLMVYLGLQQAEVEQQLSNVKLFNPRASRHLDAEERSPFLILRDPYHIAWNRVLHQLERLNFEIESKEFKSGFGVFGEGIIVVNASVQDSSKRSAGLFASTPEVESKKFTLVLSEETHEITRVDIETDKGEFDTSVLGSDFLELLYQQIK